MSVGCPRIGWSCLLTLLVLLNFSVANAQQAGQDQSVDYLLTINSKLDMQAEGQKQPIVGDTKIGYSYQRDGDMRKLSFRQLDIAVSMNDNMIINSVMNAEFFKDRNTDETVLVEDANDGLRNMLTDCYGPVICEFKVDKTGKELSRKVLATPNAAEMVQQIENARLFHSPFYADKSEWESPAKFSIGNGGFAEGNLSYDVISTDENGKVKVAVSGELIPTGGKPPAKITDGLVEVQGVEFFDTQRNQWESGEFNFHITFNIEVNGKVIAEADGDMKLGLSIE